MAIMAIMIGIQASGKSSFCKSNLREYVRIARKESFAKIAKQLKKQFKA